MPSFRENNQLLIYLVTASGLYMPAFENFCKKKCVVMFLKSMVVIALGCMLTNLGASLCVVFSTSHSVSQKMSNVIFSLATIMNGFKSLYYNVYRYRFEKVYTLWDDSLESDLFPEQRMEMIIERRKKTDKYMTVIMSLAVLGPFTWFFMPYFSKTKTVPRETGWNYKHQSPEFEIYVTYELIAAVYQTAGAIAFDWVMMTLLTMEAIQLTHLKNSLKLIISKVRVNTQGDVEISEDVKNKLMAQKRHTREKSEELELTNATEIETNIRLWIRQHQKTIRIHEELEKMFHIPMCVQFSLLISTICAACFGRLVGGIDNKEGIVATLFLFSNSATFYFSCTLGDKIKEESATIFGEAFSHSWYIYPKRTKMLFHTIIMNSQRPLDMVVFRIYPLGAQSFLKIFNFGYSFVMFLWQSTKNLKL